MDGTIPSFVRPGLEGKAEIGIPARKRWIKNDPQTYFRFKLGIGENKNDEEKASLFLKRLYQYLYEIRPAFDKIPVCFTHPNNWDSVRMERFAEVLREAGFSIDNKQKWSCAEPYAAGNYILSVLRKIEGYFLVADVGAGTFDVSLIKAEEKVIKMLKEFDDCMEFAGSHIDEMIASYILKRKVTYENPEDRAFLDEIEKAKIEVNKAKDSDYSRSISDLEINREVIARACQPFLKEAINLLSKIKEQLENKDISLSGIITSGGSGRFFLLKDALRQVFPHVDILIPPNTYFEKSDDSIALGAVLEASGKRVIEELTKYPLCIAVRKGIHLKDFENLPILECGEKLFIEIFPISGPGKW